MSLILPDLIDRLDRAGREAAGLVAELQAAVASRVLKDGRLDRLALDAEQHAAHGLAWSAAYAETLRQTAQWARAMSDAGTFGEAEALYRRVLSGDPGHLDSLHHLGLLARQRGRPDLAHDHIARAIALDDRVPELHHNLGNVLRDLGRLDGWGLRAPGHITQATLDSGYAGRERGRLSWRQDPGVPKHREHEDGAHQDTDQ